VGFYGVVDRHPAQKLELVLGIGSDGHFDACGAFLGCTTRKLVWHYHDFWPRAKLAHTGSDFGAFPKIRIYNSRAGNSG
jgi:hypothetical protein